jgi:FkbM family methyltransferase
MKTVTNKLVNGYEVEMDPNAEFIVHEIWEDLFYDRDYRIGPDDIVVDIGANIGIFSLFAAHRGATVYSVEPDEHNFRLLCSNVERNGLCRKVHPFCCAVAKNDGTIALYVPEAQGLCASGLITTSLTQIENLSGNDQSRVSITRVKSVSLPSLFRKIGEPKITLLKLDTEGAELDILAGANADDLRGVERVVMETHAAYAERELYHLVRRLGFEVITFEKLTGPFSTGYLYAVRAKGGKPTGRTRPVAILKLPDSLVLPTEMIADAGRSFSTLNPDCSSLGYRFDVDGKTGAYSTEPMCHIRFAEPGLHRITLEVLEGGIDDCRQKNMPAGFSSDRTENPIWVFMENYGPSADAPALPKLGKKYEFAVSAGSDFFIPAASIPKQWDYDALGIGVSVVDAGEEPENLHISLLHNGVPMDITSGYQEIMIPAFPRQRDLCFSFRSARDFKVRLHWFAKVGAAASTLPVLDCRNKRKQRMGEKSLAHICLLEGEGRLVVHRDILFKGRCYSLQGWYKEIHFSGEDIRDTMEYTLRVPRSRVYQVTWWPE